MRYPKFLDKKLNLIAPSFGCTTEPYKSRLYKAIEHFKEENIEVIEGENIFSSIGYRSATSSLCAKEFTDAYKDNNFIMSVGGGNLMYEILDDINFSYISTLNPTYFMGYSDNTNLTFLLTTLCDVASIYGYNAPEFGSSKLELSQLDQLALIKGEKLKFKGYDKFELNSIKDESNPYALYNLDTKKELTLINSSNIDISGRLIGGCLDCLVALVGTNYDKVKEFNEKYKDDGFIWFLESCDLDAASLKVALLQLKRAGWFKYVNGFLIGRPYMYNTDFIGLTMNQSVIDVLKDYNVPIIINADFGHLKPALPIICGSIGHIKAVNNDLEIEYILK
ncbi:MAG: LD-carboxypeptidase [Acholeplasmatales bacterium]|nr:LD-carboxypeptidase [Acholeplasmatales bacterium]